MTKLEDDGAIVHGGTFSLRAIRDEICSEVAKMEETRFAPLSKAKVKDLARRLDGLALDLTRCLGIP